MTTSAGEPLRRPLEGRSILIAEGDAAIAASLSVMLDSSGCEVIGPVVTADASVKLLRGRKVDAAVIGFHLRDRNAHAVMDELSTRRIPFLLTSTTASPDLRSHWRPYLMLQTPLMLGQVQTALVRMLA